MPALFAKLTEPQGPLVPVAVGRPAEEGQPQAEPKIVPSLVDTGAQTSFIDNKLARQLGLKATENTDVLTPSSGESGSPAVAYEASLSFQHPLMETALGRVRVIGAELSAQGFGIILGRDVLKHFLLIYSGPTGQVTLGL